MTPRDGGQLEPGQPRPARGVPRRVLVLQGGGALGSYQAGVYEALAGEGLDPDWVTGISIGAINAALIAGNPPKRRVERLREFWELVTSAAFPAHLTPQDGFGREMFNAASANLVATFGAPGFFTPRWGGPFLSPPGTLGGGRLLRHRAPSRRRSRKAGGFRLDQHRRHSPQRRGGGRRQGRHRRLR